MVVAQEVDQDCLLIFSHPGREMPPKDDFWTLEDDELHIAYTYVLLNCEEIGPNLEKM